MTSAEQGVQPPIHGADELHHRGTGAAPPHSRLSAGPQRLGLWSHCIFRRCAASLPTSLSCISSVD